MHILFKYEIMQKGPQLPDRELRELDAAQDWLKNYTCRVEASQARVEQRTNFLIRKGISAEFLALANDTLHGIPRQLIRAETLMMVDALVRQLPPEFADQAEADLWRQQHLQAIQAVGDACCSDLRRLIPASRYGLGQRTISFSVMMSERYLDLLTIDSVVKPIDAILSPLVAYIDDKLAAEHLTSEAAGAKKNILTNLLVLRRVVSKSQRILSDKSLSPELREPIMSLFQEAATALSNARYAVELHRQQKQLAALAGPEGYDTDSLRALGDELLRLWQVQHKRDIPSCTAELKNGEGENLYYALIDPPIEEYRGVRLAVIALEPQDSFDPSVDRRMYSEQTTEDGMRMIAGSDHQLRLYLSLNGELGMDSGFGEPVRQILGDAGYERLRAICLHSLCQLTVTGYRIMSLDEAMDAARIADQRDNIGEVLQPQFTGKRPPRRIQTPLPRRRIDPFQLRDYLESHVREATEDPRWITPHTRRLPAGFMPSFDKFCRARQLRQPLNIVISAPEWEEPRLIPITFPEDPDPANAYRRMLATRHELYSTYPAPQHLVQCETYVESRAEVEPAEAAIRPMK